MIWLSKTINDIKLTSIEHGTIIQFNTLKRESIEWIREDIITMAKITGLDFSDVCNKYSSYIKRWMDRFGHRIEDVIGE